MSVTLLDSWFLLNTRFLSRCSGLVVPEVMLTEPLFCSGGENSKRQPIPNTPAGSAIPGEGIKCYYDVNESDNTD